MDILSTTMDLTACMTDPRDSLPFDGAAALTSWRHTLPHGQHRYRGTTTSRIVGFQPNGTCANRRSTASCRTPARRSPDTSEGKRPRCVMRTTTDSVGHTIPPLRLPMAKRSRRILRQHSLTEDRRRTIPVSINIVNDQRWRGENLLTITNPDFSITQVDELPGIFCPSHRDWRLLRAKFTIMITPHPFLRLEGKMNEPVTNPRITSTGRERMPSLQPANRHPSIPIRQRRQVLEIHCSTLLQDQKQPKYQLSTARHNTTILCRHLVTSPAGAELATRSPMDDTHPGFQQFRQVSCIFNKHRPRSNLQIFRSH